MIALKSRNDIAAMREAGRVIAEILDGVMSRVKPGVTTQALDEWAEEWIRSRGGEPAFKGYHGFPNTLCTSVNNQVVHGIPGPRTLRAGDIISIDVGVCWKGWYADAARTYAVGDISKEAKRLLSVTNTSLDLGIAQVREGNRLSDIGHAIQQYVESEGFSVVRDFVGHGIGQAIHEEPQIPNFGEPHQGLVLKNGMALAIEPMVNAGEYAVRTLEDQWTVVTRDGSLSAHFEHTVALLDGKAEVLTR